MNTVTLYTKPGCHLCEEVERVIADVSGARAFVFETRNITESPDDLARYQNDIPVVTVDGSEVARHRLSAERLNFALDEAAAKK